MRKIRQQKIHFHKLKILLSSSINVISNEQNEFKFVHIYERTGKARGTNLKKDMGETETLEDLFLFYPEYSQIVSRTGVSSNDTALHLFAL